MSITSSADRHLTVKWRQLSSHGRFTSASLSSAASPSPRSFHTLTTVHVPSGEGGPDTSDAREFLLLVGGRNETGMAPDPCWLYDVESNVWAPLSVGAEVKSSTTDDGAALPPRPSTDILMRAYHTAVAAPAPSAHAKHRHRNASSATFGSEVWILGGKTALEVAGDTYTPIPISRELIHVSLRSCARHAPSIVDHTSSASLFGVEAGLEVVDDSDTTIGPRAYHGAAVIELPLPYPNSSPQAADTTNLMPQGMAVFGGFSGSRFIDAVSIFDFATRRWHHEFATPECHPRRSLFDQSTNATDQTSASNCNRCRAPRGCVHRSKLWHTMALSGQLLSGGHGSTAAAVASSLTRTSVPPRDAAVVVGNGVGGPGRLHVLGGEVMQTFFNSVISLRVSAPADPSSSSPKVGRVGRPWVATWQADRVGSEMSGAPRDVSPERVAAEDMPPPNATTTSASSGAFATPVKQHRQPCDSVSAAPSVEPTPRAYQCGWSVGGRSIALFGGFSLKGGRPSTYDELYIYDTHTATWSQVEEEAFDGNDGSEPPATLRSGERRWPGPRASAAASPVKPARDFSQPRNCDQSAQGDALRLHRRRPWKAVSSAFVFGGDDGTTYFADLWRCDVVDCAPTTASSASFSLRSACERFLARAVTSDQPSSN